MAARMTSRRLWTKLIDSETQPGSAKHGRHPSPAVGSVSRATTEAEGALLQENHFVDDVDDAVAGHDIGLHHGGVVDLHLTVVDGDL